MNTGPGPCDPQDRETSMAVQKLPTGTRGGRKPPAFVAKTLTPLLMRLHRRSGDRFQGMDLLYLTTVARKSGQPRTTPATRFDDGDGWIVVAAAGGMAQPPGWCPNVVA